MANTYDFYKPKLESEYPEVDGPVSVVTYVSALDQSYGRYKEKMAKLVKRNQANGHANGHANGVDVQPPFTLDDIDYAVFHAPYGKQVQKGYGRMFYNDFLVNSSAPHFAHIPDHESILSAPYKASLTDKNLEKIFIGASKPTYNKKVAPSMHCSRRCGNMYTASLYGCLASLLSTVEPAELKDKRVSVFAFGSGYASSFFSLRVKGDTSEIKEKMDLLNRLKSIKVVPCQEYVDALAVGYILFAKSMHFTDLQMCSLIAPREEPQCLGLYP
jgi:hydroxymethylglutaryl-CoA synthase